MKKVSPGSLNTRGQRPLLFKFYNNSPRESRTAIFEISEEIIDEIMDSTAALIEETEKSMMTFCRMNGIDGKNFIEKYKSRLIEKLKKSI